MTKVTIALLTLALATSIPAMVLSSPVDGPQSTTSVVAARAIDSYDDIVLKGGELTRFDIRGDGDSDLDCFVLDSDGDVVDSDVDDTDHCIMLVRPRKAGVYHLRIKNHGMANAYTLTVR